MFRSLVLVAAVTPAPVASTTGERPGLGGTPDPYLGIAQPGGCENRSRPALPPSPVLADCMDTCDALTWLRRADVISLSGGGEGVEGAAMGVHNGKLYVSHGYSFFDSAGLRIYDIATDSWTLGVMAAVFRSEGGGTVVGDRFYSFGGRIALADTEIYDIQGSTWSTGAAMPTPRKGFGTAVINGLVHLVGGTPTGSGPNSGIPVTAHEVYDPAADAWTSAAPLPVALADIYATVAIGPRLYVFGGFDGLGIVNSTWIYDATTGLWSSGAPMPTARSNAIAGTLKGRAIVIGGLDAFGLGLDVVEIYDPATDRWCTGPPKPEISCEMGSGQVSTATAIHAVGSGPTGVSLAFHESLELSSSGPVAAAATAGPVPCAGGTLRLDGAGSGTGGCVGGLEYQWSEGPTVLCPWSATPSCDVTVTGAHRFTLEVRCFGNPDCTSTAGIDVTAVPFPLPALAPLAPACAPADVTLDASASQGNGCPVPLEYQFRAGAVILQPWGPSPTAGPFPTTATTTFTVDVRCGSSPGCESSTSRTIEVDPYPAAALAPLGRVCIGASVTLDASTSLPNGCPVALEYRFLQGPTVLQDWSPLATYGPFVAPASTTFTVEVRCTAVPGCVSTASQALGVDPTPTPDLAALAPLCAGGSWTLDASGSAANGCIVPIEFQFRDGPTVLRPWGTAATYGPLTAAATATYSVDVRCAFPPASCQASADRTGEVVPYPTAALAPLADVCLGGSVLLDASASAANGCVVPLEYRFRDGATMLRDWGPGATFGPLAPAASTRYEVDVRCTASPGCEDVAGSAVDVVPIPVAAAGADVSVCADTPVTLDGSGSSAPGCPGGALYEWRQGATVVRALGPDPRWNPPTATPGRVTYTLVVVCSSLPACSDGDDVDVQVRSCPMAVTYGELTARAVAGGVEVRWTTVSEHDTLGFEVERRDAPGGSFRLVGALEAHGPLREYRVLDAVAAAGARWRVVERVASGRGDVSPEFGLERPAAAAGRARRSGRARGR